MNIFGVSAQSVKFFLVFCVTPNFVVITCLLIWLEEEKKVDSIIILVSNKLD